MIVLILTALSLVVLVLLHILPTGYKPLHDPVSNYGVGTYHVGYKIMATLQGIAGLLMAYAIADEFRPVQLLPVGMLVIFGLARLAIAWFPTDLPGDRKTGTGKIHTVFAIVFFTSITTVLISFDSGIIQSTAWADYNKLLNIIDWLAIVATILIILSTRFKKLKTYFGIWERLLYISFIAWFFVVAAHF